MKASHSVAAVFSLISLFGVACAQNADFESVEREPNIAVSYSVEIYFDDSGISITPGGVFYRYWPRLHGAILKVSDVSLVGQISKRMESAAPLEEDLTQQELNRFLSEVNTVVKIGDAVYFVKDKKMLRDGDIRLLKTPAKLIDMQRVYFHALSEN